MSINPSQAARFHHDLLLNQHSLENLARARGPGVSYTRDFAEYSAGKKTLKILSYITVVPLVIDAIRGKFQRRLTLSGRELPAAIDTGINRTDWKRIRSAAHQPNLARAGEAREQQLRSIAIKLIAATGQDHGGLKTALRNPDIPTVDLVELAVNCAHDRTGDYRQAVFDTLRSDLQSDHATTDRSQRFEAMRQQYLAEGSPAARIGPVQKLASAKSGLGIEASLGPDELAALKKLKIEAEHFDQLRPLIATLIDMPKGSAAERAAWLKSLVETRKDAVRLLCALPDLLAAQGDAAPASMKAMVENDLPLIHALRDALGIPESKKGGASAAQWGKGFLGKVASVGQQLTLKTNITAIDVAIKKNVMDEPRAVALADAIEQTFIQTYDFSAYTSQLGDMVKDLPPDLEDLFKNVIQRYFQEQTPADKKAMLTSLYRHGNSPEPMDHLVALLKGAGPFLQKMVQQMGGNVSNPELAEALQQLKENLNPIDDEERLVLLHQVVTRVGDQGARLQGVKVLSSASVAETVAVTLVTPGAAGEPDRSREVIIKLLRPGIESRAGRERAFFDRVAQERKAANPDDAMAKTMGSIADQIESELDLRMEARQIDAAQVYQGRAEAADGLVQTMRMSPEFKPEAEFLILDRMPGRSVKSFIAEANSAAFDPATPPERLAELEAQSEALCNRLATLGSMWLSESVYGSGFFHGDLHAGNLMVDCAEADRVTLGLIDFGNAATLDAHERRNFLRLQSAVIKGHPERATDALRELLPAGSRPRLDAVREQLVLNLKGLMARDWVDLPVGDVLSEFLSAGNRLGLEIPGLILQIGRSQGMLDRTFDDAHKALKALVQRRDPTAEPPVSKHALSDSIDAAVVGSKRRFMGTAGYGFGLAVVRSGDRTAMARYFQEHPVGRQVLEQYRTDVSARQVRETAREERLAEAQVNSRLNFGHVVSELKGRFPNLQAYVDPDSTEQRQFLAELPAGLSDANTVLSFFAAIQGADGMKQQVLGKRFEGLLRHLGLGDAFDGWAAEQDKIKANWSPEPEIQFPDFITPVLDHERSQWQARVGQERVGQAGERAHRELDQPVGDAAQSLGPVNLIASGVGLLPGRIEAIGELEPQPI